jgi:tRNA nucleotidyltransferase/poly(A) polymerase
MNTLDDTRQFLSAVVPGRAWLVGGAPRDVLLKRPLKDVDLAVEDDPRRVAVRIGERLRAPVFPLDEERGIWRVTETVAGDKRTYDVAALRGGTIEKDLAGRDFTINAMALPLGTAFKPSALLDLFGGRKDLRAKTIRLVSPGALREDPLRILRAFRLGAELGFSLAPDTARRIRSQGAGLLRSAPERRREELLRLFLSPRAAATLTAMDGAGILARLIPEVEPMRRTARAYYGKGGVLAHSLQALGSLEWLLERLPEFFPDFHGPLRAYLDAPISGVPRVALVKFGELLHDVGKPATAKKIGGKLAFHGHDYVGKKLALVIAGRLRLSSDESRSLGNLVRGHMRPGNLGHQPVLTDRAIFRFYRDLGQDAVAMLILSLADHFTYLTPRARRSRKDPVIAAVRRMLENYFLRPEKVAPPKVVDGHDIMKSLGIRPGPAVGKILTAIQEAQAEGRVADRAQALALGEKLLKGQRDSDRIRA